MVKKPTITNKQTLPPPPSISSFSDEESPPSTSHGTKPSAASGAAVLRKHPEPSLEPTGGEKEEDEESSEGEEAKEDEDSTENSDNAAPKPSHRVARRVARTTDDGKRASDTSLFGLIRQIIFHFQTIITPAIPSPAHQMT